jgi:heptosyltransferase-2
MKILVIQKKRVGDVLTSAILFEALKEKFPKSELHYLVYENSLAVVENNPFIDKIVIMDEKTRKNTLEFLRFLFEIRKEKYDVIVDGYGKPNSVIIGWFSGAKKTITFKKNYSKLLYTDVLDRSTVKSADSTQAIHHRMLLLEPLEIKNKTYKPTIYLLESEKEDARKRLKKAGLSLSQPIVMISAIGSNTSKTYPLEQMAIVLDTIPQSGNIQILFNYFSSQKEEAIALYKLCKPATQDKIFIDFYEENLRDFLAVTSCCTALIGNEGGATNMAKALMVPTFTIFSPKVNKSDWNIYENGTTNVSVHVNDYFTEENQTNYAAFSPELFKEKLSTFVNLNCL